ncbi:lipoprotein [Pantoea sp. BAV 3049]|uniref:lipoprotein n=1 Tax=Pantoea sp. BAV 3049 TaxID=2654188 RepID=UPI00131E1744|nr:lipoprotein [Pantoea sp. BAV 3049]
MKKILCTVLAVLVLSGCSSTGSEDKFSASYLNSHVVENKTTQAEVQSLYGVPDDQTVHSDGTAYWYYDKNGTLNTASGLAGYIPGAGAISSALGMANTANSASSAASKASGKMSGNTEYHGDRLQISFDKNKIVRSWSL